MKIYQVWQWTPFPGHYKPMAEYQLQDAEYTLKLSQRHYYEHAIQTKTGIFYPLALAQRIMAYWQTRWPWAKYQLIEVQL